MARRLLALRRRPRARRVALVLFFRFFNRGTPAGEKPSVASRMVGIKRVNNLVGVDYTIESQWLKLKGERGFMLIHGQDLGLGQLLVPNRGHYADGAPKVPSSSE